MRPAASGCWATWGFGRKLAQGKGVTALFAGPSGTGKTMAAEVIAGELGLDLYKIDLAGVVSKYIGETEKNLDRIFAAAEDANAILFFDEADALFGKRSEVRDAHDRYANIEIAYLLQKMEEYDGVAILATNLRSNLDEAFVRRLAFTVHFPFPDEADRRRIWRGIWPAATPLAADVDLDFLAAQFKLSGGNIKNIALAAAFLAAADGRPVAMAPPAARHPARVPEAGQDAGRGRIDRRPSRVGRHRSTPEGGAGMSKAGAQHTQTTTPARQAETHPKGPAGGAGAPGAVGTILRLQQTAGNRAVSGLVGRARRRRRGAEGTCPVCGRKGHGRCPGAATTRRPPTDAPPRPPLLPLPWPCRPARNKRPPPSAIR